MHAKFKSRLARAVAVWSAAVLLVGGCYRIRSQLTPSSASPEDVYRCVQLELGRAGYAIVGADRASGWLHATKDVQGFFSGTRAEIYVTVIPDEDGAGSHVQVTDNPDGEADADRLVETCALG